jgi:hypothetical protein
MFKRQQIVFHLIPSVRAATTSASAGSSHLSQMEGDDCSDPVRPVSAKACSTDLQFQRRWGSDRLIVME